MLCARAGQFKRSTCFAMTAIGAGLVERAIEVVVTIQVASLDEGLGGLVQFMKMAEPNGVIREVASRAHNASISAIVSNMSMIRAGVIGVTTPPRRGRTSTR